MKLLLWQIQHRFQAYPHTLEVTLAMDSAEFRSNEIGKITVTIDADNLKNLTLAEIESRAIARATIMISK